MVVKWRRRKIRTFLILLVWDKDENGGEKDIF